MTDEEVYLIFDRMHDASIEIKEASKPKEETSNVDVKDFENQFRVKPKRKKK